MIRDTEIALLLRHLFLADDTLRRDAVTALMELLRGGLSDIRIAEVLRIPPPGVSPELAREIRAVASESGICLPAYPREEAARHHGGDDRASDHIPARFHPANGRGALS